jgi:glycosyltransferase involved in cell wall biosynthesis
MKVLMFGNEMGASGKTHIHCERYIHLLQLAGCDVTFIEHRGIKLPSIKNVEYRRFPRSYRRFEAIFGTAITYYLRRQSMRRLWRLVKPDICHVQWIDEHLWHIARAGLRPLVATAWGTDLNLLAKAPSDDPVRQKIAAALGQLDLLIVDSEDMAATAELLAGASLRTTLLPIGIDTMQFRPGLNQQRWEWRKKLQIDLRARVLISPRQLGANYRPAEIICAFARLDQQLCQDAHLIMRTFGNRSGVSLTELHRLADKLNVSDRIRWVDEVEYVQLPGLYAAADLAINFPIMDAFPVTFLECFSCGLPVITNQLVSYESNGALRYLFCTEEDSVPGLKKAIESGINEFDQLRTMADKAREYVVQNYDERLTANALRQAYDALLALPQRKVDGC